MKNEPQPADPKSKAPETPSTAEKKSDASAPKKPGYVFKIVPADPKNAFDFEDVADK